MKNQFFLNAGVPPQLHFEPSPPQRMPNWQSLPSSSPMEVVPSTALNSCSSDETQDCFYNPTTWGGVEKSTDHNLHLDSALSSMVSSPAASDSDMSNNENFVIRELIGKLGNIGGTSDDISPHSQPLLGASSYNINGSSNSNNNSCYSTPMSSPSKVNNIPTVMSHLAKEKFPSLGKPSMALLNPSVGEFSGDPGFAERAAKFSCFGSRSFNGRSTLNNAEFERSNPAVESCSTKLSRVSSSPSLKALGSQKGTTQSKNNSPLQDVMEVTNSKEESTISDQTPNGDCGVKPSSYVNSRKRKPSYKGKAKETSTRTNTPMTAAEAGEDSNAKRSKANESERNENGTVKAEEESKEGTINAGGEKQNKSNQKPPEPPKDYIHVRARRGQATDSHSLAERVRREKISERMKLLQDLVAGCNKVTGKALMLDEIINYVQSLQRQVEFLSMKLASVNTSLEFSIESLISKDVFQSNNSMAHPIFPLDSSVQAFYGQHSQQNPAIHNKIANGTLTHSSMDPLDTGLCRTLGMQLPLLNGFNNESGSQYPMTFSEDDLHGIVQMGFGQAANSETTIQSQNFNGPNQVPL